MDSPRTSENDRLEVLLQLWFSRVESGEQPDVEGICKDEPHLAPVLRRLVVQESEVVDTLGLLGPSTAEEAVIPVERLGDFKLLSFLGAGGMGQVFLSRQESLGRLVALKVPHKTAAADKRVTFRFRREAEIAAGLEHPHIVPVYAVGDEEGYAFLAMKWLSGPALDQFQEPLSSREVARIGVDIARALHEAHESGVIHRDVKPGNIMLDGGTPYILDFGLARSQSDLTVTRKGTVPGTLPYMSPEQLRAGTSTTTLDARTDVYSLGATLFEAAAGQCAFEGTDPEVMIRQILFQDPPSLTLANRDLETIIFRAMDKDRERRFSSAAEMADDLQRFLDGEPVVSRRTGPLTRVVKLAQRHRRASLIVGGLFLVTVTMMALVLRNLRSDREALETNVDQVEQLLERGEERTAARVVESMRTRWGGASEVVRLEQELRAATRLTELVDRIQEGGEAQDTGVLDHLLGELGGSEVFDWDARRANTARMARAVVALRRRPPDLEGARRELAGLLGRDVAALLAICDGKRIELDALPVSGARGADRRAEEHVFTIIAMNVAGMPLRHQLSEVDLARKVDRGSYRVRNAHAVWLAATGRDLAALVGFEGLQRDGEYRSAALRNITRQQLVLGRLGQARETARRYLDLQIPWSQWAPQEAAIICELYMRLGRIGEMRTLLDRAVTTWPDHWKLRMIQAQQLLHEGEPGRAVAILDRAAKSARSVVRQQRARVCALSARAKTISEAESRHPVANLDAALAGTLRDLAARAEKIADETDDELTESDARSLQARLLLVLGERETARLLLREAMRLDVDFRPRLQYSHEVYARVGFQLAGRQEPTAITDLYGPLKSEVRSALGHVREIQQLGLGGERPAQDHERFAALLMECTFAFYYRKWDRVIEATEDALQLAEDRADLSLGPRDPGRTYMFLCQLRDTALRKR